MIRPSLLLTFFSITRITVCAQACMPGVTWNNSISSSCIPCSNCTGALNVVNTNCSSVCGCPIGQYNQSLTECMSCGNGNTTNSTGSMSIFDCICAPGFGGPSCKICVNGTYKNVTGPSNCTNLVTICPAGKFAIDGATSDTEAGACENCTLGTYKPEAGNAGSASCFACSAGRNSYDNRTGCSEPTPSSTSSSSASASPSSSSSASASPSAMPSKSPSTTVSSTASTSPTLSPSTTVSSTASQSVSASASALPLNQGVEILTDSILTTNILFGPIQGRRFFIFGNDLTNRSTGNGKIVIKDDFYKGQPDLAQSPVNITINSSTMTCFEISRTAQLSLGNFFSEPFCANPLFNLSSFWDPSLCVLSIVGRNRVSGSTVGSTVVPPNSSFIVVDYKELSSYLLCIEAQFSNVSSATQVMTSNVMKFNVTISIKDLFFDVRQNEPILKLTIFADCIQYYYNVSKTGGSILPISKFLKSPYVISTYLENDIPILVFPPSLLPSIEYVGTSNFKILQAIVSLASPCSSADVLNFSSTSLSTFLSAGGDGRSVQLIGSSFCGGLLEIRGAGTALEYKTLLNSLTFSSGKGNDLPSSVVRNITVSTTTQSSLRHSPAYRYYDDFISSFISVVPLNDPVVVPGGGSIAVANLLEGDAPQVQITITSNCSDEQVVAGFSAPYICLEDPDPIIGATTVRDKFTISSSQLFMQTSFYSISATSILPSNSSYFFEMVVGSEELGCSSPRQLPSNTHWSKLPTPCWRQLFLISSSPLNYNLNPLNTTFTLQILDTYKDDENITGSQTLNIATISLRVDLYEINKDGFPTITSIEGAPLPGLSVYGGDMIDIYGTGLGNKSSANPIVKLVNSLGSSSTFDGSELLNCTVVTPAKRLRCITPAGYGQSLQFIVQVYGNVSLPFKSTISYARPFVLSIKPWYNVSALISSESNYNSSLGSLNSSYLSVLPTGGTGSGSSQSLIGIEITTSGLPPMLPANAFNVSFVTGFNEMLSPRCLRPTGTTHLLQCLVPPGASASLEVKVSVAGVSSRPLLVSYANPRITSVSTSSTNGYILTIVGENLGSDLSPGAPSLDRVELLAEPLNANLTDRCLTINYAPCVTKPQLALACSYATAHTKLECALDPSSFGEFLFVRVVVAGLFSPWSEGTISYPPPLISFVSIVNTSTTTPGAAVTRKGLACNGGTRILISGSGFSATGSQFLRLFIGGIPITYSLMTFIFSDTLSPSAISNARDVIFSSVSGVQTVMPPGFGAVSIELFIGNRTTKYTVNYEPLFISSISWRDGGPSTQNRSINLFGTGLSMCALCLSSFVNVTYYSDNDVRNNNLSCNSSVVFGEENIGCAVPDELRSTVSDYFFRGSKGSTGIFGAIPNVISVTFTNNSLVSLPTTNLIPYAFAKEGSEAAFKFANDGTSSFLDGTISIKLRGATDNAASFNYSFKNLLIFDPVIKKVSVSTLDPPDLWNITLSKAGGNGGRIILTEGKSTNQLGFNIECPTVWTTLITRTVFGKVIDSLIAWNFTRQSMSSEYYSTFPSSFASMEGKNIFLETGSFLFPPSSSQPPCDCCSRCIGIFNTTDDRKVILTDSNRHCANCFVLYYGIQSRIFWVHNTQTWSLYKKELPCNIATWKGDIKRSGESDVITFVPPPWTGTANLTVNADGSESLDGVVVFFAGPKISSINSTIGPTRGEIITIYGSGFGLSDSALNSWYNMTSVKNTSRESDPLGITIPAKLDYYSDMSSIIVSYEKFADASSVRRCSVLSWSRTEITCKMPPGIPGSRNTLLIQLRDLGSLDPQNLFLTSKIANYEYYKPSLISARVSDGIEATTRGNYNVTIIGQNLGEFVDPSSLSLSHIKDEWTLFIRVKGEPGAGLVNGFKDSRDIEKNFVSSLTHESITFMLPSTLRDSSMIYEGKITFRVNFISLMHGLNICSEEDDSQCSYATLQISSPVITQISANHNSSVDADPCLALNISTIGDSFKGRGRGYLQGDDCMKEVRNMGIETAYDIVPKMPCFRFLKSTQLYIRGRNFGSGKSNENITVGGVECKGLSDVTAVVSDSVLLCSIQNNLTRGPAEIKIKMAFHTVNSSFYGFTPMAMCACDYYSLHDGQECVKCPEGAVCAGGSDKARAKKDFWETIPSEWKSARSIELTIPVTNPDSPVKHFVPCIERGMCGSNNTCLGNSTGWMCTSCMTGSSGEEMRRADDGISCKICSPEMANVVFPLSFGGAGLILFILASYYIYSKVFGKKTQNRLDDKAIEQMARWNQEAKLDDSNAPVGVYVRITVSFIQTLGAMSLYVQPSKKTAFSAEEPSPYFDFLKFFTFVNDVGINTHSINCQMPSGTSSYDTKLWVLMILPVIVVFVFVAACVTYEVVFELCTWIKIAQEERNAKSIAREHRALSKAFNDGINNGVSWSSQIVVFALPTSISAAARAQDCSDLSSGNYLKEYPIHSCSDERFKRLQLIAWFIGLLWLLIPLVIAFVLYCGPTALSFLKPFYGSTWNGASFLSNFQFAWGDEVPNEVVAKVWEGVDLSLPLGKQIILNPGNKAPTIVKDGVESERKVVYFRGDVWESLHRIQKIRFGWEMAVILRKSVLMGIATGFAGVRNLLSQILLTIIILVIFLIIHLRLDPYKYKKINYLDTIAYFSEVCGCIYVIWHLNAYQPSSVTTLAEAQQVQNSLSPDYYGFSALAILPVVIYMVALVFFLLDGAGVSFSCVQKRRQTEMAAAERAKQMKRKKSSRKFHIKNLKAPFDDGVLHHYPTADLVKISGKRQSRSKRGIKKLGADAEGKEIIVELDTRFLDKNGQVLTKGDGVLTDVESHEARIVNLYMLDSTPFADVKFVNNVARMYDINDALRGKVLNSQTMSTEKEDEDIKRLQESDGNESFGISNPMFAAQAKPPNGIIGGDAINLSNPLHVRRVINPAVPVLANSISSSRYPQRRHVNDNEESDRDSESGLEERVRQRTVHPFNEDDEDDIDDDDDDEEEEDEEDDDNEEEDVQAGEHQQNNQRLRNVNDEGEDEEVESPERSRAVFRSNGWALTGGFF